MTTQQLVLSLVLATMVFAVALDLKLEDFRRVARMPRAVVAGELPQLVLLPLATWLATLVLDLPANVEAAMILVACCPGGSLSNFVTHFGRGNVALSVTLTAVSSLVALFLMPFNFTWMVATNPATAGWLRQLEIDPSGIWWSLLGILAVPMALGLWCHHRLPRLTLRIRQPLANFSLIALLAFIVLGLIRERHLLNAQILPQFTIVILHNAAGLALGWLSALAFRLPRPDRRAITVEAGMQNSGLALGIIAVTFGSDLGMVIVASLWGIWHIVSGLTLATIWRTSDARHAV